MLPPKAQKKAHEHRIHNDVRQDDYYWLNEKENPEVIAYLEDENAYYDSIMAPLIPERDALLAEMIARIPEEESNVPMKKDDFYYYTRHFKDKDYPVYARKMAASRSQLQEAEEEVYLDVNELAKGKDYYMVTDLRISPSQDVVAYLENLDGSDRNTMLFKQINANKTLADRLENVYLYGSMEWSLDGEYMFYVTIDDMQRPYQLWRHEMGTTEDTLLFEEKDETFVLMIDQTVSGNFITVTSSSTTTAEVHLIDVRFPLNDPKLVAKRKEGILYSVEQWEDHLLILTNEGALNFKIEMSPLTNFSQRKPFIPYDDTRYIQEIYPFEKQLLFTGRENGLQQIWRYEEGQLHPFEWAEDVYAVSIRGGQAFDTDELLLQYESYVTPRTTIALSLETMEQTILQTNQVSGDYDATSFVQRQLWATAQDGTKIPLMMHYKKGALDNGPAPLILDGYGAYGAESDPFFSAYRLPLLDRGIIFVTAQIRGGGEMGRHWYEDGKMQFKRNTFTDFIDVATFLIEEDYTTTPQLAARGGSAGGLLVGAVANMAGNLFNVIAPAVPFVDVVTTMLDETIPLTTLEWDEWGNPKKEADYFYMKSYSPYDNVERKSYPHLYITTGLNDPRVGYFEPAKWVARLREYKTDDHTIVMKTNMGAGHFGSSGRIDHLRDSASSYAFILNKIMN